MVELREITSANLEDVLEDNMTEMVYLFSEI